MHSVNLLTEADSTLNGGGPVTVIFRALGHLHNLYSAHHTDSSLLTDTHLY